MSARERTSEAVPDTVNKSAEVSPLSWWFSQGYYRIDGSESRFMLALFRIRAGEADTIFRHVLLMSLLHEAADRPVTRSWIDRSLIDAVEGYLTDNRDLNVSNIDRNMAEAVLREFVEYGPPAPIEVRDSPQLSEDEGFQASWDDVVFSWEDRSVKISFEDPASGKPCSLEMESETPILDLRKHGAPQLERTTYLTFPRLSLTGSCAGKPVEGEAWFDHQTAELDEWFITPVPTSGPAQSGKNAGKMLGWEWLGANFDDGSDWIVVCQRDMASRTVHTQFAVIRDAAGAVTVEEELEMVPIRFWTSDESHIKYPVAWSFDFPNQNQRFEFEPHVADQEIRTPGIGRNIWEGSGILRGGEDGVTPIGRARLELRGYGLIFDFKQYSEVFVDRIDRSMEAFLPKSLDSESIASLIGPPAWKYDPEAFTDGISKPVWDLLDRGGKHWRPMFGLLLLETLGVASEPYEDLIANVIELNHNGSLIIDDIEDASEIRRGEECIHLRYGVDVAINAGNSLYFLPYLLLGRDFGLSDKQLVALYRIIVNFQVKAHFGQGQDIQWSKQMAPKWLERRLGAGLSDQALQMYAMKTAAATQGTAEAACVIAGASDAIRSAYADFGRTFGVAFQVIDDTLNFSTAPTWTKVCGEDLACGKPTYVIIRALELLQGARRRRLAEILCDKILRKSPDGLATGIELIRESGAIEDGRKVASEMLSAEWKKFSEYAPPSEAKSMLRMLTAGLLKTEDDY